MLESVQGISVILPVYNREGCIAAAIESVIAQTVTDWELIIIDDGSTDATETICRRYAQAEPRIRLLRMEHQGVSSARNSGLLTARGKWVVFLDSDDVYVPDAFRIMLDAADGMDLVAASMRFSGTDETRLLTKTRTVYSSWLETVEKDFHQLYAGLFYGSVCAKMYRRASMTARFTPDLPSGEDARLNLSLFPVLQAICVLPDMVYKYNYDPEYSHGRRIRLTHLRAQRQVLDSWSELLFPRYEKQMADVFRDYIEFLLVFLVRMSCQHNLPLAYCQELLTAQQDVMLADERRCGFDQLPVSHQAFWRLLKERNMEQVFASLDAMVEACFGRKLTVYTL